jgi:hypothetical protein
MRKQLWGTIGATVATAAFIVVTGQSTPAAQAPAGGSSTTQAPTAGAQTSRAGDRVTITGCVQREADYRRSTGAGRGGAVGTGAGVGNEYILANASMSTSGSGSSASSSTPSSSTPTGTAGTSSGTAYELTGPNEGQAAAHVGKRVEIVGMLKPSDTAPAGGGTANVPGSQELKLRELEISSIRETTGSCPTTTAP